MYLAVTSSRSEKHSEKSEMILPIERESECEREREHVWERVRERGRESECEIERVRQREWKREMNTEIQSERQKLYHNRSISGFYLWLHLALFLWHKVGGLVPWPRPVFLFLPHQNVYTSYPEGGKWCVRVGVVWERGGFKVVRVRGCERGRWCESGSGIKKLRKIQTDK